MTNFIAQFIELVEQNFPQLKDKIQHGAVDAETVPPYAAYTVSDSEPVRSIHGIAGFKMNFNLTLVGESLGELDELNRKIIQVVEMERIDNRKCSLVSFSTDFFEEVGLNGIITTFKII